MNPGNFPHLNLVSILNLTIFFWPNFPTLVPEFPDFFPRNLSQRPKSGNTINLEVDWNKRNTRKPIVRINTNIPLLWSIYWILLSDCLALGYIENINFAPVKVYIENPNVIKNYIGHTFFNVFFYYSIVIVFFHYSRFYNRVQMFEPFQI